MEYWQAKVMFQPGRVAAGLFIFRRRDGVKEFLVDNDTILTVTPSKPIANEDLVFAYLEDDQLKAIQQAISEYGVKPPEASFTQGKLEAVTEHLADLRKLVFEPGVIKVVQKGKIE